MLCKQCLLESSSLRGSQDSYFTDDEIGIQKDEGERAETSSQDFLASTISIIHMPHLNGYVIMGQCAESLNSHHLLNIYYVLSVYCLMYSYYYLVSGRHLNVTCPQEKP